MSPSLYTIVFGVGPGIGRNAALRFARSGSYAVVAVARSEASYKPIVDELEAAGQTAVGIAADAADSASIRNIFTQIDEKLPDAKLAAAVYNPSAGFSMNGFLDTKLEEFNSSLNVAASGLFAFAQHAIPRLLAAKDFVKNPPTLIVTGATASLRGGNKFSSFAPGKFAQRGLTQSLAREFGPQGVHVAYTIIDGGIDTPRAKDRVLNGGAPDGKMDPAAIADSYWHLHTQHRSAFTQELDLRPYVEKF